MAIFEDVRLSWKGREHRIAADRVLRVIAAVEDVITLGALHRAMTAGSLPLAKLATAYAIVLRHAGVDVTEEEVYAGMFSAGDMKERAVGAVALLQTLMIPPESLRKAEAAGNGAAAAERAGSSPKRTSSRSGKAG